MQKQLMKSYCRQDLPNNFVVKLTKKFCNQIFVTQIDKNQNQREKQEKLKQKSANYFNKRIKIFKRW